MLEYTNEYFTKANQSNPSLIKRKPQRKHDLNISILRNAFGDNSANSSKLSNNKLQILTRKIAQSDYNINNNINILNEKLAFLSYCNNELINKRNKFQNGLNYLKENEKYFEKIFYYLIQTYCPSIIIFSNILLDHRLNIPSPIEIDINEFVSQIVSQIKHYWNEKSILEPPKDIPKSLIETIEKGNLKKLFNFCKLSTKSTSKESLILENEISFCGQLIQFQKEFLNNIGLTSNNQCNNDLFLNKKIERNTNANDNSIEKLISE